MSVVNSSQKFIARNRTPRVQIEYDVEVYGSEKRIELPFVMGVLADLSGKPAEPLLPVADRKFLEVDVDNFDERMKAMQPRVAFAVPNTLSGEGQLRVDMTFESIEDFSPAAVAGKVDALKRLLEARTQLANLQTYMDGKSGAEALINQLLQDPALLHSLASAPRTQASEDKGEAEPEPESEPS
ncbi:type VI secretion system contractile sheath small subunit [Cupriavidus oxalaticus]|jgi:type VI secretion system protein ImpB|uniref:type VI secretion system contractile sheath small subunit n=1 Tax=Cupriavidus oxalaticus TaxID=96344 RepID=UPI0040344FE9